MNGASLTADTEFPFTFECMGEQLIAIHHGVERPTTLGVVIIVGGPQYRVGSHRQFLELARFLAAGGVPVLRFDYRGMGDSSGEQRGFEEIDEDIRAAVDALMEREPALEGVVLWGLCDAASAAMMYAARDRRIRGLVLANPWVHTESGEARTRLRHYYLSRLFSRDFWSKMASGRVDVRESLSGLAAYVRAAVAGREEEEGGDATGPAKHFLERMQEGLSRYHGKVFLILSGKDLTADEFRDLTRRSRAWRRLVREKVTETLVLEEANHTFSTSEAKRAVEEKTLQWMRGIARDIGERAA